MKKVKIIGVPEHFNFPWHLAIEEGAFEQRGIDLQWTDVPEGTGKMCEMLEGGETDLAIILTEGIVKSITEGNPTKIVQEYITTPLLWGIHVATGSRYTSVKDLKNGSAAISRYGSGSHLMAYVHAKEMGWDVKSLKFEVVNTLEGAVRALTQGSADYFMWEHFTTKPLVDQGIFRRLGDCPTPWPCFVVAATDKFLTDQRPCLRHVMEVINTYTQEFKNIPSIDRTLSNKYQQQLDDIREWLSMTRWSQKQMDLKTLELVQAQLLELALIEHPLAADMVLAFT